MKSVTVTQVNEYIAGKLNSDFNLKNIPIEGEITGIARRGHVYFSLKDDNSIIRAAIWKSALPKIDESLLVDGKKVIALGSISPYAKGGTYSISVTHLEDAGIGKAAAAYEALKKKLSEEGLFDQKYKKPIPEFPKCIGVVTSTEGDALRDIKKIILSKNNYTDILIFPAFVQGIKAPESLVEGIETANYVNKNVRTIDTLIIGRGGGSKEEMSAFDDEGVARAIFASDIPVISAVGHETHIAISDWVADRRAETPTKAAEIAAPDINEIRDSIERSSSRLYDVTRTKIASEKSILKTKTELLHSLMVNKIESSRMALERSLIAIREGDPRRVFEKGYAAVLTEEGQILSSINSIEENHTYRIKMKDGYFTSTVNKIER